MINLHEPIDHALSSFPTHNGNNNADDRPIGLNVSMKAYNGQEIFGAGWEEYLEKSIRDYTPISEMCYLTPLEKTKCLTFMIRDDALDYYSDYEKAYGYYEE